MRRQHEHRIHRGASDCWRQRGALSPGCAARCWPKLEATLQACTDGKRLRAWLLRAPRLNYADFAGLVLRAGH